MAHSIGDVKAKMFPVHVRQGLAARKEQRLQPINLPYPAPPSQYRSLALLLVSLNLSLSKQSEQMPYCRP
jgi:hypothetical protein